MVSSTAGNVHDYLSGLAPPRRDVMAAVRTLVNRSLPSGVVETIRWGMISWEIPLARYPNTYNQQPLSFAGLAAQKNNFALYLNCVYVDPAQEASLRAAYTAAGKPLDMGKSCLRFKRLEDVVQEAVAAAAAMTVDDYIAHYEKSCRGR